jgi:glyoxylase-like metal-dependent hydrolase (beta-lactamase superfamily II)
LDILDEAFTMEIVPGIHRVDGVNANVYLVIDGREVTVIDTGMPRNAEKIVAYARGMGLQPSRISKIILTHCHVDHAGSAHELKKITGAKIAIHREDADYMAGGRAMPSPKGGVGVLLKLFSLFFKFTPVQPDIILEEKDKVGKIMVIHTPGHTPGSISLYDSKRKVLFVGDALRFVKGKIEGPPERFTLDAQQAEKSVEKISKIDFDVMLSGHGEPLKSDASAKIKEFCKLQK